MAAFFLFPRVLFVELLDFYRFQNTRFYLYILSLFAIRLFIGQAFPVPAEWQDTISIDPGLNNPLSAHWYAVDYDGNVYVVAEHYEAGRDIDYHAEAIGKTSERIGWKRDGRGRLRALIDSAASQRTLAAVKSVSELFYERGVAVEPCGKKDVFGGIAQVKSYLNRKNGQPNLYIFSCCTHMIREFKGYFWGAGESPVKRDDHAMDDVRQRERYYFSYLFCRFYG